MDPKTEALAARAGVKADDPRIVALAAFRESNAKLDDTDFSNREELYEALEETEEALELLKKAYNL